MDHDDQTIGTIYTRRQALAATAKLGGFAALLGATGRALGVPTTQPRDPLVASPAMTEGPFFNDDKLDRANLLGDTDRPAVVEGVPLALAICVYRLADAKFEPLPGATVDVWHCDALGVYSGEDHPMNHERTGGQTWLRGYQTSDADGLANFETIVPGWYPSRAPHIHFKVRAPGVDGGPEREFTSQLFFNLGELEPIYKAGIYAKQGMPQVTNERDGIYLDRLSDGTPAGALLTLELVKHEDREAYWTQLPILLTDESLRGGGGFGRPRGGPGGPPRRRR